MEVKTRINKIIATKLSIKEAIEYYERGCGIKIGDVIFVKDDEYKHAINFKLAIESKEWEALEYETVFECEKCGAVFKDTKGEVYI